MLSLSAFSVPGLLGPGGVTQCRPRPRGTPGRPVESRWSPPVAWTTGHHCLYCAVVKLGLGGRASPSELGGSSGPGTVPLQVWLAGGTQSSEGSHPDDTLMSDFGLQSWETVTLTVFTATENRQPKPHGLPWAGLERQAEPAPPPTSCGALDKSLTSLSLAFLICGWG